MVIFLYCLTPVCSDQDKQPIGVVLMSAIQSICFYIFSDEILTFIDKKQVRILYICCSIYS